MKEKYRIDKIPVIYRSLSTHVQYNINRFGYSTKEEYALNTIAPSIREIFPKSRLPLNDSTLTLPVISNEYVKPPTFKRYLTMQPFQEFSKMMTSQEFIIHDIEEEENHAFEEAQNDDHCIKWSILFSKLGTDINNGLTDEEAFSRLKVLGPNAFSPNKERSPIFQWLLELTSGFGVLLMTASVLSILCWRPLGSPPDTYNLILGIILMIINLIQGTSSFLQKRTSNKLMASIGQMMPFNDVQVLRSGNWTKSDPKKLVIGDIVHILGGDRIPADIRIHSCTRAITEKSSLTGESEPIELKTVATDRNPYETLNLALYGTTLLEGELIGVIIATGDSTKMGRLLSLTKKSKIKTTLLQKEIKRVIKIVVATSFVLSVIMIVYWISFLHWKFSDFVNLSQLFTAIIGMCIAITPEGLPFNMAMILSIVAKFLLKRGLLVKDLGSTETLGATSILATDKTGTLTQNKMRVMETWVAEDRLEDELRSAAILCNKAKAHGEGNPTEIALIQYVGRERATMLRQKYPIIAEIPFNSKLKFSLTTHKLSSNQKELERAGEAGEEGEEGKRENQEDGYIVYKKGALERMPAPPQVEEINRKMCEKGQRVIAFCKKVTKNIDNLNEIANEMDGWKFLGLVALMDPPRPGINANIKKIREAGINIIMMTGDHPLTAKSIAQNIGIMTLPLVENHNHNHSHIYNHQDHDKNDHNHHQYSPPSIKDEENDDYDYCILLTGPELDLLSDNGWNSLLKHKEIVLARTTPEHKLALVKRLQRSDQVVAVTGDGVNDSAALKSANIGIAMGSGSEVAREAAGIILAQNEFEQIVIGISLGRLLYDNLKKVTAYLLPAGFFSEIVPLLLWYFMGIPLPLTAFEMIIICTCTDVVGCMALAYEPNRDELMMRPPRNIHKDHLFSMPLALRVFLGVGMMETIISFCAYFWMLSRFGIAFQSVWFVFDQWGKDGFEGLSSSTQHEALKYAQTAYFASLVICQFWNLQAVRTEYSNSLFTKKMYKNTIRVFIHGIIMLAIASIIIYIPFINHGMDTRPLPADLVAIIFGMAFIGIILLPELIKLAIRMIGQRKYLHKW